MAKFAGFWPCESYHKQNNFWGLTLAVYIYDGLTILFLNYPFRAGNITQANVIGMGFLLYELGILYYFRGKKESFGVLVAKLFSWFNEGLRFKSFGQSENMKTFFQYFQIWTRVIYQFSERTFARPKSYPKF